MNIKEILNYLRGESNMTLQNHLDPHSQKFYHNWTRPKHAKSQVNGHTMESQNTIILRSNAKAHRW